MLVRVQPGPLVLLWEVPKSFVTLSEKYHVEEDVHLGERWRVDGELP